MQRGLIVINAYPNGEKFLRQSGRIAEELESKGIKTDVMRNGEIYALLSGGEAVIGGLKEKYAFVVYLDKDKYLGRILESAGFKLFNSAEAVEICDDKITTYIALSKSGLPLIDTIPAPLCYTPKVKVSETFLKSVEQKLGFPMVVKKSYGSFGEGVQLVHGREELQEIAQKFMYVPHCYQRYVAESSGKDIRVVVIGGKAVAWMRRVAQEGEFRSNVELGGKGEKTELSKDYIHVAERVAEILKLDYCGVDLLETKSCPVLCEVNSNAFFEGLEKTTGINVAEAYATHILSKI